MQVRLERVGYAAGRGRKENGKPFLTSVTIIVFETSFAKLHFRLKRSFCKGPPCGARCSKVPATFRARNQIFKSKLQVRLERVGYAAGRERKENGKPFVTSVTIIVFETSFAKLHFRLKRSFCKGPPCGARCSKVPATFRARNQIFKSKYKE